MAGPAARAGEDRGRPARGLVCVAATS